MRSGARSATQFGPRIESGSLRDRLRAAGIRVVSRALDREERAEKTYAGLMSRVGALAETDLALSHQLAWMNSLPEAW
jgi:hypothetical protein